MYGNKSNIDRIRELTESLTLRDKDLIERHKVFEHILENSTDGWWDWDIPSGEEYLSDNFKKQLGFEPHEMENKPDAWMKYCDPDDLKRMMSLVQKHFDTKGEEAFACECKFTSKDGSDVWILCRGAVVKWGEDDKPIRMVGTHTDITIAAEKMIERLNGTRQ